MFQYHAQFLELWWFDDLSFNSQNTEKRLTL